MPSRLFKLFWIVVFSAGAVFPSSLADAKPAARTILALYDPTEQYNRFEDNNLIHKNAEMVLNHLGMKVRYHDLTQGLPPAEKLEDVHGILTWFRDESLGSAEAYLEWAIARMKEGKKFVVLENPGAFYDPKANKTTDLALMNTFLNLIGLEYRGGWTENPFVIRILEKNPEMVEFERTLDDEAGFYDRYVSKDIRNQIFLKLGRTDMPDSESHAVMVTPQGGFALQEYVILMNYYNDEIRWRLNPFLFFEKAFGLEGRPRLDTTTLFGRRIFYSHIDGDGIRNVSEVRENTWSGQIVLDHIIRAYPLPITVSLIAAEVDPHYLGSPRVVDLARELLREENVEIGVHGFSHPLDWEHQVTTFRIKNYSRPLQKEFLEEAKLPSDYGYQQGAVVTVDYKTYLKREVVEAVDTINQIAPEGKKAVIYQWTGNCEPPGEAIQMAYDLGLVNINRGDTRLDRAMPSYSGVAPLARQDEGKIQVQTSNANENIYTEGWDGPYDRYAYVVETMRETEYPTLVRTTPRRVTPINVYYHFYSGEKKSSLGALKKAYDYALSQKIIPLFTSSYARVVLGFFQAEMEALEDGGWVIRNYGEARTVRLDRDDLIPDFSKSKGILGFSRWEGHVYIHLADAEEALLYLTSQSPSAVYLEEASTVVRGWKNEGHSIQFQTEGFGIGVYRLSNLKANGHYEVRVSSLKKEAGLIDRKLKAGGNGDLEISVPVRGPVSIQVVPR